MTLADVRPAIEARPAGELAVRAVPDYPGRRARRSSRRPGSSRCARGRTPNRACNGGLGARHKLGEPRSGPLSGLKRRSPRGQSSGVESQRSDPFHPLPLTQARQRLAQPACRRAATARARAPATGTSTKRRLDTSRCGRVSRSVSSSRSPSSSRSMSSGRGPCRGPPKRPALLDLDRLAGIEQRLGLEPGAASRHRVQEVRLVEDLAHRLGLVDRRDGLHLDPVLRQRLDRRPQVSGPVADVGAEAEVGESGVHEPPGASSRRPRQL